MTFDVAQIDELLTTTRAVRRRLDLDRLTLIATVVLAVGWLRYRARDIGW